MIGERIRGARIAAGLTQESLAQRLRDEGMPITKQAVSNYEAGKRTPSPMALMRVANALGVTPSSLLRKTAASVEWISFRCQSKLGEREKKRIQVLAEREAENRIHLEGILSERPNAAFPSPIEVATPDEAEEAAMAVRARWGLGDSPIASLVQTAEAKGAIVVSFDRPGVEFDGLSGRVNGSVPLIVANATASSDRIRFSVAHEIAHLVMNVGDQASVKKEEQLAHRFAGALLAPASGIREGFGSRRRSVGLNELALAKRTFGLSMQALLFRLRDLAIITDGHYSYLCKDLSMRGWRKQEPVSYDGNEEPMKTRQMVSRALAEGIISDATAKRICSDVSAGVPSVVTGQRLTPTVLLRMAPEQRKALLQAASDAARPLYEEGGALSGFDAFGEDDIADEP